MFDLPSYPLAMKVSEGSQMAIIQQVQQTYGVTVSVRPHQCSIATYRDVCVVIVRGSVGDYKAIKEAANVLFGKLAGGIGV